jgi:hypothetical protein
LGNSLWPLSEKNCSLRGSRQIFLCQLADYVEGRSIIESNNRAFPQRAENCTLHFTLRARRPPTNQPGQAKTKQLPTPSIPQLPTTATCMYLLTYSSHSYQLQLKAIANPPPPPRGGPTDPPTHHPKKRKENKKTSTTGLANPDLRGRLAVCNNDDGKGRQINHSPVPRLELRLGTVVVQL